MSFYMRNYTSEERFDLAKFINFQDDVYDVIDSPFLAQLNQLSTVSYYDVDERGYRDIDLIATDFYGDQFFAYLIQFYNGDFREKFPEGTVLRMFSLDDLHELYFKLSAQSIVQANEAD